MTARGSTDACVLGAGAVTAAGANLRATAAAVRAGLSTHAEDPDLVDHRGESMVLARSPFPGAASGPLRWLDLATPAMWEALAPVDARPGQESWSLTVLLALPAERPGFSQKRAAEVRDGLIQALSQDWRVGEVVLLQAGHAGGLIALGMAQERIAHGRATLCLVGGVDSYLEPSTLEWLDSRHCLHSPSYPWGFTPGEAGAFCVLGSQKLADAAGVPILASVQAVGVATERNLIRTDTVCTGEGLSKAVRAALVPLAAGRKVDFIFCDQNGERYRAEEWGFTIGRVGERFNDPTDLMTCVSTVGDVGAAGGPLLVGLALTAARKGYAPGPAVLLWASSDSGERCAVLLHAPVQPRWEAA